MDQLEFEWDELKCEINIKKHGIDFADVTGLFYDEKSIIIQDPQHYDEELFIALGMDTRSQIVVVVHVYRDIDLIRIISARKADPKERGQYVGDL